MSLGQIVRSRREDLGLTQDQVAGQIGISKPYLSNIETGKAKNPPSDRVLKALEGGLQFPVGELTHMAHLERTPMDVRQEHELLEAQVQKLRGVVKQLLTTAPRDEGGEVNLEEISNTLKERLELGQLPAGVSVPVINKVSDGYPNRFTDPDYPRRIAQDYIRCPDLHDPQAFAIRVVGDSMEPRYHEADIVVFSPVLLPRSGDDCFIRFEGSGATAFRRFYPDDEKTIRLQPLDSKYPSEMYQRDQIAAAYPGLFRIERLRQF